MRDVSERHPVADAARLEENIEPHVETSAGVQERAEDLCQSLFLMTGAGVIVASSDGKFVDVNPAFCDLIGYRREELVGRAILDLTHENDRAETRGIFEELRAGKRDRVSIEKRYLRKDGTEIWVHVVATWRFDEQSRPLQGVGVVQEITKLKRAEQALRQSRDRLESIVITATDAIITINARGVIDSFNPAAEAMFGYAKEEALGENVSILMPSPHREEHDHHISRYLETGERRVIGMGLETVARRKDGSLFPIELALSEVEHLGLFTAIIRDISERKRAEAALEDSEKRLRALSSSLLTAQEEERRNLASELHDDLGHKLALLGMEVDRSGLGCGADNARTRELVEDIAEHIRNLSHRIHPSAVEHLGLIVALRKECETMAHATRREISFHADNELPRHPPLDVAMCFYRVAQEALRNAVRHSGSKVIEVSLERGRDGIRLTVEDWGKGFRVGEDLSEPGLGLLSMEERARLIGGEFRLESTEGRGTIVRCWAPLPARESSV